MNRWTCANPGSCDCGRASTDELCLHWPPPDAHRGAVPPDPTRQAAQRLLELVGLASFTNDYPASAADVRLVAEAVMEEASLARRVQDELEQLRSWAREQNAGNAFAEQVAYWCSSRLARLEGEVARSAENAETCASGEACCCCGSRYESRDATDPWEGRLDGYCYECALARCDAYPGECPVKTAMSDLARREAALQAEVVRLREALEAAKRESVNARRVVWWIAREQPRHRVRVHPTMHRDSEMELVREDLVTEDGWQYIAAVVYGGDARRDGLAPSAPTQSVPPGAALKEDA